MNLAKVVFWKYQKNKKGESPIFIRVIEDRKARYIKTSLSAKIEDWDAKENLFRTKYRKAEDLHKIKEHEENNAILLKKLSDANMVIKSLIIDERLISSKQVKDEIKKSRNLGKGSVLKYIDEVIRIKEKEASAGTVQCYKDLKRSLKKFAESINKTDLTFKDITADFLKSYEMDFRKRECKDTGISFYMRTLRAVFNRAIKKDKVCKKELYPFNDYLISELDTDTIKRAISKEDIAKIAQYEAKPDSQIFHSKNLFLFSYFCRGINFVDMGMLKWDNINGNRMTYIRQKTGKYFDLELLKPALQILNHYKKNYYRGENSYIFPILDENKHKSQVTIRNRLHKVLGQTNKDLKELGKELGIKTKLTTYVARHTFATVMRKSGASYSTIKDTMGQRDEKTTQIYIDSIFNDELDKACEALL